MNTRGRVARRGRPVPRTPPLRTNRVRAANGVSENVLAARMALVLWAILLFSPQWALLAFGAPRPILRVPLLIVIVLLAMSVPHLPRAKIYWPLLLNAVFIAAYYPFAWNPALARRYFDQMVVVAALSVVFLIFLRRPNRVRTAVLMATLGQFLWYAAWGFTRGGVPWHQWLLNPDGFGAYMAIGLVSCAFMALASKTMLLRVLSAISAILCAMGVVSSWARGAFLAAVVTMAFGWVRAGSKRVAYAKVGISLAAAIVIGGQVFLSGATEIGSESWFDEISSISDDVEDTDKEDRRLMWRIAVQEFKDHPILGVGPGSYGAYAADNYSGPLMGERFRHPETIYNRLAHNIFFQTLSEQGLVGVLLFGWLLVDFWQKNSRMRRGLSEEDQTLLEGFGSRWVVVALEMCVACFLLTGMFYNMFGGPLIYLLVIANTLLYHRWQDGRSPGAAWSPSRRLAGR